LYHIWVPEDLGASFVKVEIPICPHKSFDGLSIL
jgi:hypothetical protein